MHLSLVDYCPTNVKETGCALALLSNVVDDDILLWRTGHIPAAAVGQALTGCGASCRDETTMRNSALEI